MVEDLIRSTFLDLGAVEERSSVFGLPLSNTFSSPGLSTLKGSVLLPRGDELPTETPHTRVFLAAGTEGLVVASPFSPQASVLPRPMLSPPELLEHRYPGCFVVNEAQNSYTCTKCFFSSFGLDNGALMFNAGKHLNSEKHAANTKLNKGQQNLFQCGIVSSREQFPSPAALPPPAPNTFCKGYWLPTVTLANGSKWPSRILLDDLTHGMTWRQDKFTPIRITGGRPFAGSTITYDGSEYSVVRDHEPGERMITIRLKEDFQAEPKTVPLKECGDALFASSGSYFSFDCVQHCLNLSGKPYPDLMCRACRG